VGGNSGPLPNEVTWNDVQLQSGYPFALAEYTTTTKRLRRVGLYSPDIVRRAAVVNRPTEIAVHGVDYLDYSNVHATSFDELTPKAQRFILDAQTDLGVRVSLVGTGPASHELFEVPAEHTH